MDNTHHSGTAHLRDADALTIAPADSGTGAAVCVPTILVDLEDEVAPVVLRALYAHLSDSTVEWTDRMRETVLGLASFIYDQLPDQDRIQVPPVIGRTKRAA